MRKNVGSTDQIIRISVAVIIAVLYFMNIIAGTLGVILLSVAGIFVLTSLVSFCPLYTIFGMNTCPVKSK